MHLLRLHQIAFHSSGIENHGCHRGEACRVAATLQLPIETECGTQSELSPNCKERAPCDPFRLYLNTRDASMAAFQARAGCFFPPVAVAGVHAGALFSKCG